MAVEVKVPESGESISEVQIGAWRKSEGDEVELDEILVEIETDKAAMDLPAPVAGILKKILKGEGEDAAPGDVIAMIEEGGADGAGKKAKKQDKEPAAKDGERSAKVSPKKEEQHG
jgi:2-oxoglutarate dehydrogenase E2 component (dihydrolipoamide succinyltransferase)